MGKVTDEELESLLEGLSDDEFEAVLASLSEAQINEIFDALDVPKAPKEAE